MGDVVRTLILVAIALVAACSTTRRDAIDTFDVTLTLLADGSLQVEERIALAATVTPRTSIRRASPIARHDGVFDVRATLDGRNVTRGEAPTRLLVSPGPALGAEIRFPESTAAHAIVLSYRAANVVHLSGIRGRVSWPALPRGHGFDVKAMTVSLTLPPGAIQLTDPWVEEAGWTVVGETTGVRATRAGISAGEPVTIGAEFTIDTMAAGEASWQYHEKRAREFMPAFVSAGICLVIVGAGILIVLKIRFPRARFSESLPERLAAATALRTSAIVVTLAGLAGWPLVRMTLGDYGPWPLCLPAGTVIVGLMLGIAARQYTSRL